MAMKRKTQNPLATPGGGARGGSMGTGGVAGRVKSVKVSSNVTVKAPKGKTISSAEQARLANISKAPKTTKGNKNALKASGKPAKGRKANTMYAQNDIVKGKLVVEKGPARKFAQRQSEKRTRERRRAGFAE